MLILVGWKVTGKRLDLGWTFQASYSVHGTGPLYNWQLGDSVYPTWNCLPRWACCFVCNVLMERFGFWPFQGDGSPGEPGESYRLYPVKMLKSHMHRTLHTNPGACTPSGTPSPRDGDIFPWMKLLLFLGTGFYNVTPALSNTQQTLSEISKPGIAWYWWRESHFCGRKRPSRKKNRS